MAACSFLLGLRSQACLSPAKQSCLLQLSSCWRFVVEGTEILQVTPCLILSYLMVEEGFQPHPSDIRFSVFVCSCRDFSVMSKELLQELNKKAWWL